MVEPQPSKLAMRVRFPSPALRLSSRVRRCPVSLTPGWGGKAWREMTGLGMNGARLGDVEPGAEGLADPLAAGASSDSAQAASAASSSGVEADGGRGPSTAAEPARWQKEPRQTARSQESRPGRQEISRAGRVAIGREDRPPLNGGFFRGHLGCDVFGLGTGGSGYGPGHAVVGRVGGRVGGDRLQWCRTGCRGGQPAGRRPPSRAGRPRSAPGVPRGSFIRTWWRPA